MIKKEGYHTVNSETKEDWSFQNISIISSSLNIRKGGSCN
jgi:hypothetical protein